MLTSSVYLRQGISFGQSPRKSKRSSRKSGSQSLKASYVEPVQTEERLSQSPSLDTEDECTNLGISRYECTLNAAAGECKTNREFNFFDVMDLVSKKSPCMLGIDEAGRGPVLGPMVYACAVGPVDRGDELKTLGLADSKTLTEDQREKLLKEMLSRTSWLTSGVHVISPVFITEKMLDRLKTSLNTISHDAAIGLIRSALDAGIHVTEVYVDTVGKAERYQTKLEGLFPQLKICVESKADDTYAIVSAASIFAKVTRDRLLQLWPHSHRGEVPHDTPLGSGYPGDPLTKKYLEACLDPVFGFPPLVRSSWSTATTLLDKRGVHMTWEDDEDFEKMAEAKRLARKREMARGTCKLSAFFAAEVKPESKRALTRRPYFIRSGLEHVENLV